MAVAEVVAGAAQLVAGLLFLSGHATVPALAVLAAVNGTAASIYSPASTGLVPHVATGDDLQSANALMRLSEPRRDPRHGRRRRARRDGRGRLGAGGRRARRSPSPPSCSGPRARRRRARARGDVDVDARGPRARLARVHARALGLARRVLFSLSTSVSPRLSGCSVRCCRWRSPAARRAGRRHGLVLARHARRGRRRDAAPARAPVARRDVRPAGHRAPARGDRRAVAARRRDGVRLRLRRRVDVFEIMWITSLQRQHPARVAVAGGVVRLARVARAHADRAGGTGRARGDDRLSGRPVGERGARAGVPGGLLDPQIRDCGLGARRGRPTAPVG